MKKKKKNSNKNVDKTKLIKKINKLIYQEKKTYLFNTIIF